MFLTVSRYKNHIVATVNDLTINAGLYNLKTLDRRYEADQ